jgi:hypothetical protein
MNRIIFGSFTALVLSACIFLPDDDGSGNPFLGQWKSTEESSSTVRDSVMREEFKAFLLERGYDFTNVYPEPSVFEALVDSFSTIFSCTTAVCDSILKVYESYLVFSADSFANVNLVNDEVSSNTQSIYAFDADSIYVTRYDIVFDSIKWSAPYRFSANHDTLILDDESMPLRYVRNSDPLPDL